MAYHFRLAELSILASTATAALVIIRSREMGSGKFVTGAAAAAFLLACLVEVLLVWRATAQDSKEPMRPAANEGRKSHAWCYWDAIGTVIFTIGLVLAMVGVALLL